MSLAASATRDVLEQIGQDCRYALRGMRKSPGFTLIAVLTLALGIGANSAIFSVVNAALFERLPFPDAGRLVMVGSTNKAGRPGGASPADFADWKEQGGFFEQMAAKVDWSGYDLTGEGEPEQVIGVPVSASVFPMLRAQPIFGRTFSEEEDQPGAPGVVVLGYGLWNRRFARDPRAIGQTLYLNGRACTVIGVMPPGFYLNRDAATLADVDQVWVPLAEELGRNGLLRRRDVPNLRVWARLKPGVTLEQAQAQMQVIAERLQQSYPSTNAGRGAKVMPLHQWGAERVQRVTGLLEILVGAVAFVLLISCSNLANMQLSRATTREKEFAVRLALGAGRWRLIRQLLTESVVLAGLGGILGLLLASWSLRVLAGIVPDNIPIPRLDQTGIDSRVLAATTVVALLTGILFGLAPALQLARGGGPGTLDEALKGGGRSATGSRRGHSLRRLLVLSEVTLALVLLIGAGLTITSLVRLQNVDPGFDPRNVLTAQIPPPDLAPTPAELARRHRFVTDLLERLRTLPGVGAVGLVTRLPLTRFSHSDTFHIEGENAPVRPRAVMRVISAGYLQVMGIPLLRGRSLSEQDTQNSPPVVVINETTARNYWPGQDPVGKHIKPDLDDAQAPWFMIVGVVGNVKNRLSADLVPEVYWSYHQAGRYAMGTPTGTTLVIRTAGDPLAAAPAVKSEIYSLNRNQPVTQIQTMEQVISRSVAPQRLNTYLFGVLGAVGLLLGAGGIYGVMSYSVSQRTREIGIRVALGAEPGAVLRLVVSQGMGLVGLGVAFGLLTAYALTRTIASMLYGVTPRDPVVFTVAALVLGTVALAANYIPARKATRVDPVLALRQE